MRLRLALSLVLLATALPGWSGKQRIVVRLREPLRAETVKIRVPELSNTKGETRDLETRLELGGPDKDDAPVTAPSKVKLNMALRAAGKNAVQVTLTLPDPGNVQVALLDFYGKNQGTLLDGPMPAGVYTLGPVTLKDGEH